MRRTIGILLDHSTWRGIPSRRTGHEKISYYNQAAQKHGMLPFYFPLEKLMLKNNKAKGYLFKAGKYHLTSMTIPPVIHNRSMPSSQANLHRLQELNRRRSVFNSRTRYSKHFIHRLLEKKGKLQQHLPKTMSFSKKHLEKMMDCHSILFVKPVSSSVGKGIIRLERVKDDRWTIQAGKKIKTQKSRKLYSDLRKRIGRTVYLIQEAIPLAQYKGKPFDIRVSVQRGADGEWQITGMVGKVAAKGSHVTNVARGGRVKRCEKLFADCGLPFKETKKAVKKHSLQVAKHLGRKLKNLADIGLDVGIDKDGKPFFIEMNGRDLRYSFRNANLMKQWYKTYENPIRYGKFLYRNK